MSLLGIGDGGPGGPLSGYQDGGPGGPLSGYQDPGLFNDLLTVLVPVGKNRPLAVKYHVLTRLETLLPITGWRCLCDYHHPPSIFKTTPIVTVDEEVTAVAWISMD